MGRELAGENEEACTRMGKVDLLVESLRTRYTDRLKESLRNYEFNFVISDPRLPENPIVYASEGFCKMSGYSREEVLGRNCRILQGPGTDRRTVLELRDAIREERSAQVRILNYTKEGKPFWNLFHLAPVFSKADGSVTHFVGVQTPISSVLGTARPERNTSLSLPKLRSDHDRKVPWVVDILKDPHKKMGLNFGFPEPSCRRAASADGELSDSLDLFGDSERHLDRAVPSSSGKGMHGGRTCAEHAFTTRLTGEGMGVSDACKPQERETYTATHAARSIVCQLVESSKGKEEVLESRDKQVSECTGSGVVCSSLLLSISRIQQSFVLADPHLPDTPIVHASDLFLHLTGYSREEVMGRNCRFLQGPGTDPASVAQIRESMSREKSCSVRLLNYRKDKRPFWNLLHVSPVRCSKGKVAFYVGVQLHVSAVDKEEEEELGLNARQRQLGTVAAVRVAVRSLQGEGLRRTLIKSATCYDKCGAPTVKI